MRHTQGVQFACIRGQCRLLPNQTQNVAQARRVQEWDQLAEFAVEPTQRPMNPDASFWTGPNDRCKSGTVSPKLEESDSQEDCLLHETSVNARNYPCGFDARLAVQPIYR